jgi:DNA-binding CsgD family transcriptional regulator
MSTIGQRRMSFVFSGTGRGFLTVLFFTNGANGSSWFPIYLDPSISTLVSRFCVYLIYCLILFAIATRFFAKLSPLFRQQTALWVSTFIATIGVALMCFGGLGLIPPLSLYAGIALFGLGGALPVVAWNEIYALMSVKSACLYYSTSSFLGISLYTAFVLFGNFSPIVASVILMCFPVVSLLTMIKACAVFAFDKDTLSGVSVYRHRIPMMLVAAMFIYGCVFGVFLGLHDTKSSIAYELNNIANVLGMGFMALVFVIWVFALKSSFDIKKGFRPLLPIMVTAFLLVPIFFENMPQIVNFSVYAGYFFMTVLGAATCAEIVWRTKMPPLRIVPMVIAAYSGGMPLGSLICALALRYMPLSSTTLYIITILSVVVLTLGAVYLINETNIESLWGLFTPSVEDLFNGVVKSQAAAIETTYSLTRRERELLPFLLSGKSANMIADLFSISVYTVRAHVANIYRKLEIHSQQELRTLAEGLTQK